MFEQKTIFHKFWHFLRTYILTIPRFDLFLQGTLLIVILLEANVYLLLKRDADTGYLPLLIRDWVFIGSTGTEFLFGALLSWYGRKKRNYALACWIAITAASGLLVLAFPFAEENIVNVELCGGDIMPRDLGRTASDPMIVPRTIMLIFTAVLCSLTKLAIWSLGLTYLDDHEPQNGPYFYGILISIRLSLGLSGENWLVASSVRNDWWVTHISLSMLTLMFAILFLLFPKRMPGYEAPKNDMDDGFFVSLREIFHNKAIVMHIISFALLNLALFEFVRYDASYIQARFHVETLRQDPRTSRLIGSLFRPLVVIFFIMIFRVRFSVRRQDGVKANTAARVGGIVAFFAAIFFVVLSLLSCGVEDLAGIENNEYTQPSCSQQCNCNSEVYGYTPLCVDGTNTFFSPCHAGCSAAGEIGGLITYHNCSCSNSASDNAVMGSCSLISCQAMFSVYQVIFTVTLAVTGASALMQGMVPLRTTKRSARPLAVGASLAAVALPAHLFGRLLYMLIGHVTCAYSNEGACLFHNTSMQWMPATSAMLALLSGAVSLIASKCSKNITNE
ncbi:solute carrier organic anion transporter family member 6C1-like [Galleria mellonella]|uniref:Solute carrier organic anion transporter family member 6C1-like n=1 Tax=Galleria mellonella TaxID=7137 RepID=A0ABM3N0F4_GALME|nr:solute carrier organic anion transporter family member 6C1-like [Galleria mellonella]